MNALAIVSVEPASTARCSPQSAAELVAAQFRAYNEEFAASPAAPPRSS